MNINGWHGNYYYQDISSYSSTLIDLKELIASHGDNYSFVENISVRIQKEITTYIEFRIDLNKTTEKLPVEPPAGNSYYVVGNVQKYNSILLDSKFFYHNLGFHKLVNAEYLSESTDFNIISNGWDVSNVKKWEDVKSGSTNITLTAERNIKTEEILTLIFNFDVYKSLIEIGEKDLLLIGVILALFTLFSINTLVRKSTRTANHEPSQVL